MASPQEEGRRWERELAERLSLNPVAGSGSGIYKLDVGGYTLLVSCKWTGHESFRVDRHMIQELRDATVGPGGIGGHIVPIIASRVQGIGADVGSLELDNLVSMLEQGVTITRQSKDHARRERASIPGLWRDD